MTAEVRFCGRKPPLPNYKEQGRRWVDLRSFPETLNAFIETKPTHVIHTAARVGGLGANMNYMGEFFYDNMLINP